MLDHQQEPFNICQSEGKTIITKIHISSIYTFCLYCIIQKAVIYLP
jgi:hypothetical protein